MIDTEQRPRVRCPRCNQPEPELFPAFGSPEHKEWIARRLSRNLRFRRMVEGKS
jgi:hypothetical protein